MSSLSYDFDSVKKFDEKVPGFEYEKYNFQRKGPENIPGVTRYVRELFAQRLRITDYKKFRTFLSKFFLFLIVTNALKVKKKILPKKGAILHFMFRGMKPER